MNQVICIECESKVNSAIAATVNTGVGAAVCPSCMELYYIMCGSCLKLVPRDESLTRDTISVCAECYAKPISNPAKVDSQGNPESLICEYIALHAEEKRIKTRMEELKESLKEIASAQQRVSNAVTLRGGEQAVKCSFRSSIKFDQEIVESVAARLDESEFEELFEKKVSYNPHKERVQEFLNSMDDGQSEARELLRSAITETETATLTVVPYRKE